MPAWFSPLGDGRLVRLVTQSTKGLRTMKRRERVKAHDALVKEGKRLHANMPTTVQNDSKGALEAKVHDLLNKVRKANPSDPRIPIWLDLVERAASNLNRIKANEGKSMHHGMNAHDERAPLTHKRWSTI